MADCSSLSSPDPPPQPCAPLRMGDEAGVGLGAHTGSMGTQEEPFEPRSTLALSPPRGLCSHGGVHSGEGRARGLGQQQILTISSHGHLETTPSPPLAPGAGELPENPTDLAGHKGWAELPPSTLEAPWVPSASVAFLRRS